MHRNEGNFSHKHTTLFIIMICCILLNHIITSAVTAPFESEVAVYYAVQALCTYLTALIPLFLMKKWKLLSGAKPQHMLSGFLFGIPCIILIIKNLMPLSLINPMLFQVQRLSVSAILLANFGVGLMEEAGCRGVLLPLLCRKWSGQKNGYRNAALFSSGLFACVHLTWIVNAFLFHGSVSFAECMGRLYQVYYAFCFGMLSAGVTLYAKSILPMVIWHSLIDVSAFIAKGILPWRNYIYYYETSPIGLHTVFIQMGILKSTGPAYWILIIGSDAILLISGILLLKKKQYGIMNCRFSRMIKISPLPQSHSRSMSPSRARQCDNQRNNMPPKDRAIFLR